METSYTRLEDHRGRSRQARRESGLRSVLLGLIMVLIALPVRAAEIEILSNHGDYAQIMVRGPIEEGDATRFSEISDTVTRATVLLESPGGSVRDALSIGADIVQKGYATLAGFGDGCFSACALVWVSGVRRYMVPDGLIGVHAAYSLVYGKDGSVEKRESGYANAQIGGFLNELGLTAEAIGFFTIAGPDELQFLTPDRAQRLNIDVFIQDGFDVTTPDDRPTPRRITNRAAILLAMSERCSNLLDLDKERVQAVGLQTLKRGHDLFGGATFGPLIAEYVDRVKRQLAARGDIGWCLQAEETLRTEGIRVPGLDGPGFDCSRARTPSESLVCDAPALWAPDQALNWLAGYLRAELPERDYDRFRDEQRNWLRRREQCGRDLDCTKRSYRARLLELGVI